MNRREFIKKSVLLTGALTGSTAEDDKGTT